MTLRPIEGEGENRIVKIAMLHGPRDLRIEEHDIASPSLEDDQIWVETLVTGFKIGTDRGNYEGAEQVPGAWPDYPRWVGDSNLGVVKRIGAAVTRALPLVIAFVSRYPHQSDALPASRSASCECPKASMPKTPFLPIYTPLGALCYHKAHFVPGERVAVIGLGVLGMGAVALGPLMGGRVMGLGNSAVRLEMAHRMGAHQTMLSDDPDLRAKIDQWTAGEGIDLVILTANPWPAYPHGSRGCARRRTRFNRRAPRAWRSAPATVIHLICVGFTPRASLIAVNGQAGDLYPSQADRLAVRRSVRRYIDLMADGRLKPSQLVSHRMPHTDMVKAYEMAYKREKNMLNVVFDWQV